MAAQLIQGHFPGYNRPQVSWGQSPVIWGALCYRKTSNIFLIIFQQVNISIVRFFHGPCDSVKLSWPIWHIFAPFLQTNTNLLQSGSNRTYTVCYRWGVLCLWRLYYLCNIIRFCRFMIYMCFFFCRIHTRQVSAQVWRHLPSVNAIFRYSIYSLCDHSSENGSRYNQRDVSNPHLWFCIP